MDSFIQREVVETLFSGQVSPMLGLPNDGYKKLQNGLSVLSLIHVVTVLLSLQKTVAPKAAFPNSGNDQWGAQASLSHIIVAISACAVLVDCCPYH